jgi:outer membrane protein TolC
MINDRLKPVAAFIAFAVWSASLYAQQPAPPAAQVPPLTLGDAVQLALANYPAVQEQRARAKAAEEEIAVARTAYLPRVDALWQETRATHNNVFGILFPQGVVPPVSGPVLPATSESVWGSAAGALVSWDAVDFGQRKAAVDAARAQQVAAAARAQQSELDTAGAAADAFLTVLAVEAAVRAAQANVDRLQVFGQAVITLVSNQLRPGVDQSRAEAELAVARNQLAQAQQNADIARATLAEAIGRPGVRIELVPGRLSELPTVSSAPAGVDTHPAARVARASIDATLARERMLERSVFPRIALQSAASARASGAISPGIANTPDGLWPRVSNWAAGVSVTIPVSGLFTIKPQQRAEAQNEIAERAHYDQTIAGLQTQQLRAAALLTAASAIAQNMPTVRRAADDTQQRARARYDSGLANITEVAEAQHLLAQAEADDAVARLAVWRALLAQAQAAGDLTPFLDRLRVP